MYPENMFLIVLTYLENVENKFKKLQLITNINR